MHSHVYIVSGFFQAVTATLSSCDRDCVACNAQNIYYVALYRKHLPASALVFSDFLSSEQGGGMFSTG